METYVQIIYMIVLSVYIAFSIIMAFITWMKTLKSKNAEKIEALKNKTQEELTNLAMTLIEDAEKFKNYTGEEKLNYVVTRLKQVNQNLYDENGLIDFVNKLVDVTKKVNVQIQQKGGNR